MNNLELIDTLIKEKNTSIDVHKNILEIDNSRRWFHNKMIKECEEHIEILFKIKSELEEYQKLKEKETPKKPVKGKIIYNSYENIQTYHCSCGRELSFADNYCGKCGTEIDWEEVKNNERS